MVKLLLRKGADPNAKHIDGWTALTWAACEGKPDVVKLLKNQSKSLTLTDLACLGDIEGVERVIREGAAINGATAKAITPLMGAAGRGRLDVMRLLLDKGADANRRSRDGATAFTGAAEVGSMPIMKLLLDKGADVNVTNGKGMTAMKIAREKGRWDMVELLKAHGEKE